MKGHILNLICHFSEFSFCFWNYDFTMDRYVFGRLITLPFSVFALLLELWVGHGPVCLCYGNISRKCSMENTRIMFIFVIPVEGFSAYLTKSYVLLLNIANIHKQQCDLVMAVCILTFVYQNCHVETR